MDGDGRDRPSLAVVVPTFNEHGNVERLVGKLHNALQGIAWEAIFVDDDSGDGTIEELHRLCREHENVRLVHRIGRRGLSSAVVEGILSTTAPYVAVIDADLQHDEKILPEMLQLLTDDKADIAVGSRYMAGGGTSNWDERRLGMSRFATRLAQLIVGTQLSDPMSGFFMLKREAFEGAMRSLSAQGYKILLDIIPKPANSDSLGIHRVRIL